jgi:CheY-like chemotaxis protein
MPLILAIESDRRQAARISSLARDRLNVELLVADSAQRALQTLAERTPDLILTPQLMSPKDEAALDERLRELDAAGLRVQTLMIPVLASSGRRGGGGGGGLLNRLRRTKDDDGGGQGGCDPAEFAAQIADYLERAAEERATQALIAEDRRSIAEANPLPRPSVVQEDVDRRETFQTASSAFESATSEFQQELAAPEVPHTPPAIIVDEPSPSWVALDDQSPSFAVAGIPSASFATGDGPSPSLAADEASRSFAVDEPAGSFPVYEPSGSFPVYEPSGSFPVYEPSESFPVYEPSGSFPVDTPSKSFAVDEPSPVLSFTEFEEPVGLEPSPSFAAHVKSASAFEPSTIVARPDVAADFDDFVEFEELTLVDAPSVALGELTTAMERMERLEVESPDAGTVLDGLELLADPELPAAFDFQAEERHEQRRRPVLAVTRELILESEPGPTDFTFDRDLWMPLPLISRRRWPVLQGPTVKAILTPAFDAPPDPDVEFAKPPDPDERPARKRSKSGKPFQDEWGFFDPVQCGFAALLAKLDEVTDDDAESDIPTKR